MYGYEYRYVLDYHYPIKNDDKELLGATIARRGYRSGRRPHSLLSEEVDSSTL